MKQCLECHEPFRRSKYHPNNKIYCSPRCKNRVASRLWRKKVKA